MRTIKNLAGGRRFRNLPALLLLTGTVLLSFTASCDKWQNNTDDPENFVNLSVSDVSDGHFTVDFQAGENTKTIEYAVCYAVNMKADSVAFMEGSLDNIQQVSPGEDGKISVPFDFSDPLDFGPYTVYARAISESGQVSRFVKEQVCALTTGITIEYVSRSHYRMKASYHGNEFILAAYRLTEESMNDFGGMEGFNDYVIQDASSYLPAESSVYNDGEEFCTQFQDTYTDHDIGVITPYPTDQWFWFATSDGTEITGVHAFKVPLQEYDTSIPLPDSVKVTVDYSNPFTFTEEYEDGITFFYEYFPVEISMGSNIDSYFLFNFGNTEEEFMEFFRENIVGQVPLTEDEMLKWYLTGGAYYRDYEYLSTTNNGIAEYDFLFYFRSTQEGEITNESFSTSINIIVCPLNWNDETIVCFVNLEIPEEYYPTGMGTKSMGKKVTFTAPVTYCQGTTHQFMPRH